VIDGGECGFGPRRQAVALACDTPQYKTGSTHALRARVGERRAPRMSAGEEVMPPPIDEPGAFDSSAIEEMAGLEMEEPQIDGEEEVMAELPQQDDPLTEHVTAGGIVSTYRNADERKQRLEMKQAGDYIRAAKQQVADTTKDLQSADIRMRKAQSNANAARQEAQALYDQLVAEDDAERSVPNRHGVALARQRYDAAAYRMRHADAVAQREYSIVVWQQDRVNAAEQAVMKTEELEQRVLEMESAEREEMQQVAEYRGARELEAAERQHRAALQAVDELQREREDREMRTEKALMVAEDGQRKAKQRLSAATQGLQQKLQELADYRRAEKTRQQQALLSLKSNSEEAYNKMAAVNERNRKKKLKEDAAHEAERKVILQNGGNPYEVFRSRREKERQEKEYQKLVEKQRDGEAKIAKMMVREEELFQRDMKQRAIEKEYELHFQKEMGLAAKEERVDKFMKKRALGGVDIIDPTSIKESALVAVQSSFDKGGGVIPAPLHGSHNTVVKTSRFGLGDIFERANDGAAGPYSDEVLEAVKARHPGTTFDPMFVPPEYKVPDDGPEQFDAAALGNSAVDRYGELVDELAQPEFKGMWKDGTAYGGEESRGLIDPEEVERQRRESMKIKTTKLSKLEKGMMDTVPDKIRKNIVKPQIACGREFKGKSFLAENLTHPELQDRIEFRDFKVGQVYKQTIRLTNVSYTFNTFKLKHLGDDIRDFFEIKYKLPGYISAGLTCDLHITFEPKIPEDINTELPILAETGHIGIPLICSTPKTKISVEPRVIEFIHSDQGVPLCEEVTEYITITNSGALGTGYSLMDPEAWTPESMLTDAPPVGEAADDADPVPEVAAADDSSTMNGTAKVSDEEQMIQDIYASTPSDRRVLRFDKAGLVQGYKSVRVPVTFRPCVLGQWKGSIIINFADEGTPDVTINFRALVTEVPIFLKRPINDFQTVCYNHVYRDSLVVYNRGKTAMKCELSLPEHASCLRKSLEFLPPLGFPQNGSFFAFQLKFRPEPKIWNKIPPEYGDPETGKIEFPMLVTVPDQSLPVRWTLKAQLTPAAIKFEPDILDFGACSCNESVAIDVKITNTSALPQEVGFVRLKAEIDVQPWDGFFPLKPGQSTVVQARFAPRSAIDYQFPLTCKAITGKQTVLDPTLAVENEYTIHCRGRGVFPPLKVSNGTMKMAAVAEGGRTSESVVLSNTGKDVRHFEFTPQPESNLYVSPMHGSLSPGEQLRITMEFRAPTEEEAEPEPEAEAVDGEVPVVAAKEEKPINERWSVHKKWLVPCFFKPEDVGQKRIVTENLHVQVHTTVIRPIVADGDGLVYRELDFGQVALGPGKVVKFMLHNKGTTEAAMSCSTLDPNGPFLMLSGSRPIPAGGAVQVVMCFDPPEVGLYEQTVRIQTSANEYIVVCKGEGMRPKLRVEEPTRVEQPDITSSGTKRGQLHVGDAVCTKTVSKTLKLCNETEQPMAWSVGITELKRRNANGLEPFYVVPPQGTIAGGGEMEVDVRFCPDHQSTGFGGLLNFDVPSQNETHAIDLTGRGWACGTYIVGGDEAPEEARSDMMAHVLPDLFEGLGSAAAETKKMTLTLDYNTPLPEGMSAPAPAKGAPEVDENAPLAVGLVVVGNAGDAGEKAANGDVAFDALPPDAVEKGFGLVVGGKLAFGPQDSSQVAFTFRSPALAEGSSAATLGKLGIGYWAETKVSGMCKGGTPAPEGGASAFELTLRAYVAPPAPPEESAGKTVTVQE
jgi:hypothetical protein